MRGRTIMRGTFALSLALWLAIVPRQAGAQAPRMARSTLGDHLARVYDERPAASGLAGRTRLIEVFAGRSGSWTLVVTTPDGRSGILAVGEAWQTLPATQPDDGARS
jgi:hypothetical protein